MMKMKRTIVVVTAIAIAALGVTGCKSKSDTTFGQAATNDTKEVSLVKAYKKYKED